MVLHTVVIIMAILINMAILIIMAIEIINMERILPSPILQAIIRILESLNSILHKLFDSQLIPKLLHQSLQVLPLTFSSKTQNQLASFSLLQHLF
jgi:hypothetical protein